MNFFEHQDQARQTTRSLILLFSLAVLTMIVGIYCAAVPTLSASPLRGALDIKCVAVQLPEQPTLTYVKSRSGSSSRRSNSSSGATSSFNSDRSDSYYRRRGSSTYSNSPIQTCKTGWWQPKLLFWVILGTVSVVGGASWYKIASLKQGGSVIAEELGGRLLLSETATAEEHQLLNVVEEMAIASGISVPAVYLLDTESNINAFAAGYTPNNAVIGVTRGSLEQLTRDELQGVIAHEFSHILNGDMRMNIRLMGLLHGILFIYLAGRILTDSRDQRNGLSQFGIALILIGGSGLFFGRLIKSAVSRQREFLADASAVQFTRNPDGISGALEKLAGIGSQMQSPRAEASSHMFFGSALNFSWFENAFATHPPLMKRIQRIKGPSYQPAAVSETQAFSSESAMGFAGAPAQVIDTVGTVAPEHYKLAQGLLADLPEVLRASVRERQSAIALIYALLDPQPNSDFLNQIEPPAVVEKAQELHLALAQVDPRTRLPLLDLTIPVLRQGTAEENKRLLKAVLELSKLDGQWSMTEFVVFLVLQHRLNFLGEQTTQFNAIAQVWTDCLNLLSALSRVGGAKPDAIAYAFRSGVYRLPGASTQEIPEQPPTCHLGQLRQSLERLRVSAPKIKQAIVDACAHTVLIDNKVTPQEAELLRAIVILLDCPIPPFLDAKPR